MKTYFGANAAVTAELASATRLALYSVAPTVSGGGTELSGSAYARATVTWGAPSNGAALNTAVVDFPIASADWAAIVAVALLDVSGNIYRVQTLGSPISILSGQFLRAAIGAISVTDQ